MKKVKRFRNFQFIIFLFWINNVSSEQVHTFNLEQKGINLEFRISLTKDSFYLLETITFDVTVKNVSQQTLITPSIKSPWWTIKHESGLTYRYPDGLIPLASRKLGAGDSAKKNAVIAGIIWNESNIDSMIAKQYFPLGKYMAYYGPDTTPFLFRIIINTDSRNNFRRKKFVEFCETHQPGKFFFDTTWGVPTYLEAFSGGDLAKDIVKVDFTEKAYEFLENHKEMFGIGDPRHELKTTASGNEDDGFSIYLKQFYNGIEVYRAENCAIRAHFLSPTKLKFIASNYQPDIHISTEPKIDKRLVIKTIKRDLKTQKESIDTANIRLVVLPFRKEYYLAWIAKADWFRYFIDARSGKIIHKARLRPRY